MLVFMKNILMLNIEGHGRFSSEYRKSSTPESRLLLLSHFSRVRLCVTPQTAAHQAPPSLGYSRQEHWRGLPLPSPMHERKSESEVAQSCPTLSDPMDCSQQALQTMGFSRQEYWSGLPLPSPQRLGEKENNI